MIQLVTRIPPHRRAEAETAVAAEIPPPLELAIRIHLVVARC